VVLICSTTSHLTGADFTRKATREQAEETVDPVVADSQESLCRAQGGADMKTRNDLDSCSGSHGNTLVSTAIMRGLEFLIY
jgi:hypothetical protein